MMDPEDILVDAIERYPGHCADYYAGMCRFNIPYVRRFIKERIKSGQLKVVVGEHRDIWDEAVELT